MSLYYEQNLPRRSPIPDWMVALGMPEFRTVELGLRLRRQRCRGDLIVAFRDERRGENILTGEAIDWALRATEEGRLAAKERATAERERTLAAETDPRGTDLKTRDEVCGLARPVCALGSSGSVGTARAGVPVPSISACLSDANSVSAPALRYARSGLTISPCTSVSRKCRPWYLNVSRRWSMPRQCSTVAWRSYTWTGSATML